MSVLAQALVDETDNPRRDCKTDTFAPATPRENERIYPDNVSIHIDQWSPTVAWIDRRIRLDVHHRLVRTRLARHGADYAHRNGVLQAFRTSDGKHQLTLSDAAIRQQRQRRQIARLHLQQRKVRVLVDADQLGLEDPALPLRLEHRALARWHWQDNANLARPLHHMCVGHDVAAGIHDDARPDGPLPRDQRRISTPAFFDRPVTGYQDLDHALRDLVSQCLQVGIELHQAFQRGRRVLLPLFHAFSGSFRRLRGTDGFLCAAVRNS